MIDVLFINPGNSFGIYQDLAAHYVCIEPPTWGLLLAESVRSIGFNPKILDVNAENLTDEEAFIRVKSINPKLICFVVYGQNVNASAVGMSGATRLSSYLKNNGINTPISYVGSYVQALPRKTLEDESSIDIVFTNEGVYALRNLLLTNLDLENTKGIARRKDGKIILNPPEKVVPNERMDIDLPGYAWDLLPFKDKPFDLYRAPMWHAGYKEENRSPYCAIQTSLGCVFSCNFCIINMINRNDNEDIGVSGNYSKMRYWSTDLIIGEFEKLWNYGVRTIKITDELFLFNKKYFVPLCQKLKELRYGKELNLWAYSRVDTVCNPELLSLIKDAGIKYLALGIESANRNVRLEVTKGKFQDVDIKKVVTQIQDAGIEVMANYIFGLPGDTTETIRETLDLAKDLCTSGFNIYAAANLPGSKLYSDALKNGKKLPSKYTEYSFHSYDTICNYTKHLSAAQILKFRDDAFIEYHTNPDFLSRISRIYGDMAAENIKKMCQVKLKRKLLGD